ncbi:hypothetical protein [Paenibacillus brevis]|uniref:GNAT family N-acetyltransferase n=1 Tax=Paenibacillus brevis TaxID=2841508 RepID=A0ABS6FWR1_9BACL|nr:hypothetical protein [Paenibacillus brevis]MBU5673907.1 hypothetical protein [Paenibacillus brevis]
MLIKEWQPEEGENWELQHGQLLTFVQRYTRGRLTAESYHQLMKLSRSKLLAPGSSLLFAHIRTEDGPLLAGLSCLTDQGRGVSVVVVNPFYRNLGIGSSLLSRQLARLGEITCLVAPDNPAGLQMCLNAGLSVARIIRSRSNRTLLECCGKLATVADRAHLSPYGLHKPDKVGD